MKIKFVMTALVATGVLLVGQSALAAGADAKKVNRTPTNQANAVRGLGHERTALIRQVVTKWSAYVQQVRGVRPAVWARSMGATFAAVDIQTFKRAAAMTTYEGMIATLLGQKTTDARIINAMAKDSSVASLQALASPTSEMVYTMVTPCRILDTRVQGGPVLATTTRDFEASRPGGSFLSQGGSDSDCGIPADPGAVVLNVVVIRPQAPGFVTLFPYGVARPLSSTINNVVGADVANETIVKQTIGDAADFSVYAFSNTNILADVVGYFAAPTPVVGGTAGQLDCTTVNGTTANLVAGEIFTVTATCPVGYALTGGGSRASGGNPNLVISESYPNGSVWTVSGKNTSTGNENVHARANCCRVP